MSSKPTAAEHAKATDLFVKAVLSPIAEAAPFSLSFRYDGKEALPFLPRWKTARAPATTNGQATVHSVTLNDPNGGLQCRCEITTYADFPAVEWVVSFKSIGSA